MSHVTVSVCRPRVTDELLRCLILLRQLIPKLFPAFFPDVLHERSRENFGKCWGVMALQNLRHFRTIQGTRAHATAAKMLLAHLEPTHSADEQAVWGTASVNSAPMRLLVRMASRTICLARDEALQAVDFEAGVAVVAYFNQVEERLHDTGQHTSNRVSGNALWRGDAGHALGFAALHARLSRVALVFAPQLRVHRGKYVVRVGEMEAEAARERHVVLAGLKRLNGALRYSGLQGSISSVGATGSAPAAPATRAKRTCND